MTVKDILDCITEIAPLHWQESYDNAGLQVGDMNAEARKALICLDITEEIVDEAIAKAFDSRNLHRACCDESRQARHHYDFHAH